MAKPKHYRPAGKKKEGNAAKYITRNKALNRLQIKLPVFRRLCILKGIHPREPKKKFEGHNKTYYHVKDINFLAHERLLEKSREIRAFEKKIKKARAKENEELAVRLERNKPTYSFDHLVKERYPSFIDALRDLDDPLTMIHLFATLPADTTHKIPVECVHDCRRLSLEWQAYIVRTHSLRKTFVSVKGIYYQAEVTGQKITWLTPHVLSQVLPDDVDFRVMLTFVEFYETLMGFVNFKLYHSLGLKYPPILDPRLEAAAAELYAVMRDLAGEDGNLDGNSTGLPAEGDVDGSVATGGDGEMDANKTERRLVESQTRLALLQDRLSTMERSRPLTDQSLGKDIYAEARGVNEEEQEDEDTHAYKNLFRKLKFFLSREVPREALLFIIPACGGTVSWEGDGAPFRESDDDITHQIVDRPTQGHIFLTRNYVQPQWVFDCLNNRILLPTDDYLLGRVPPPHLSPFVDNEAEGYIPEYAETIKRLQAAAPKYIMPLPGAEDEHYEDPQEFLAAAVARRNEASEALTKEIEEAAAEKAYREDLEKELAGIPYSASLQSIQQQQHRQEEEAVVLAGMQKKAVKTDDDGDEATTAMAQIMMPRKARKLYEAMQMGKAKKRAEVELLQERKRKASKANESAKKKMHID
eukprot:c28349_g1_i1 orf=520-2442(-)